MDASFSEPIFKSGKYVNRKILWFLIFPLWVLSTMLVSYFGKIGGEGAIKLLGVGLSLMLYLNVFLRLKDEDQVISNIRLQVLAFIASFFIGLQMLTAFTGVIPIPLITTNSGEGLMPITGGNVYATPLFLLAFANILFLYYVWKYRKRIQ